MELRELAYFVAVAEESSFTRGARRVNVVQSTASAAVGRLEHELAQSLFRRATYGVELTAAGELLLRHAREMLASADAARTELTAADGKLRGTVTIGTVLSTGTFDLGQSLRMVRAEHPAVELRVQSSPLPFDHLLDRLIDGTFDLALVPRPDHTPSDVHVTPIGRLELLPVTANDSALPTARVSCADLASCPFIDFPSGWANRLRVDEMFEVRGLTRDVVVEVVDPAMAITLVRAGLGVAFLPRSLVERRTDVRVLALDAPPLARTLVLARLSRAQSPAVHAIHDTIRTNAAEKT